MDSFASLLHAAFSHPWKGTTMKFAKWTFLIAGIFGLASLLPLSLAEMSLEPKQPEFFYGFVFLNLCWQISYLMISANPVRFRPMMIPAFLAKGSGVIALTSLYLDGRVSSLFLFTGAMDGTFALLFLIAFIMMPKVTPAEATQ